jgi:tetratricopeptide (TPR) repeat protein
MKILNLLLLFSQMSVLSQINCTIYKDSLCKRACEIATNAGEKDQGSKESQEMFDQAIEMCPNFDYAYSEKSVPHLKRGDFIAWKKLIDKAVQINPKDNLGYRGWCKYQFLRDYKGALSDLERLDSLNEYDIGYSKNGDYHLRIVIALCYKGLGNKSKAISLIKKQLADKKYSPFNYDYFHLGVLYYEIGDYPNAINFLKKQIANANYFAETYYYLGLAYKKSKNLELCTRNLRTAENFYAKGFFMRDSYTNQMDKVFLADVINEINALINQSK